jgi:hypothetical protein
MTALTANRAKPASKIGATSFIVAVPSWNLLLIF